MNHSGDAAEQIVRLSLEGVEVAARITGTAAKEIAVLLIAALKSDNKHLKTKGKARLTAMLNSGKPLEIFSVKESDLKTFTRQSKEYGVVYCALRNTKASPDGVCDILVKADDAPKINRIVERFKFATVDKAKIESEIVAVKTEQSMDAEPEAPDLMDTEQLLDDFLAMDEGAAPRDTPETVQAEPHVVDQGDTESNFSPRARTRGETTHPLARGGEMLPTNPPSEPISESKSKSARATSTNVNEDERSSSSSSQGEQVVNGSSRGVRPSVREELREIKAARKETEKSPDAPAPEKPKDKPQTTKHKQPKGKRIKSKKGTREI